MSNLGAFALFVLFLVLPFALIALVLSAVKFLDWVDRKT